jgi:hypothetical protein
MSTPHIARKRFGQNFLIDHSIIDAIVQAIAPQAQDLLVEIGPGLPDPARGEQPTKVGPVHSFLSHNRDELIERCKVKVATATSATIAAETSMPHIQRSPQGHARPAPRDGTAE